MKSFPLIPNMFFLLTQNNVIVSTIDNLESFYSSFDLADTEANRQYVYKKFFNITDVSAALPAFDYQTLVHYAEVYDGPQKEQVRGIAACILMGESFSLDRGMRGGDGGTKIPRKPIKPIKPSGDIVEQLKAVAN